MKLFVKRWKGILASKWETCIHKWTYAHSVAMPKWTDIGWTRPARMQMDFWDNITAQIIHVMLASEPAT